MDAAVDVTAAASAIRALWEDVRQDQATQPDERAALELARRGYTANELAAFLRDGGRDGGPFAHLQDAVAVLDSVSGAPAGESDPGGITTAEPAPRRSVERGEVITSLVREVGRERLPGGVAWAMANPGLSDEQFDRYVALLRSGKRLVVDEATGWLVDPDAPPPAPKSEERRDDLDPDELLDDGRAVDPDE